MISNQNHTCHTGQSTHSVRWLKCADLGGETLLFLRIDKLKLESGTVAYIFVWTHIKIPPVYALEYKNNGCGTFDAHLALPCLLPFYFPLSSLCILKRDEWKSFYESQTKLIKVSAVISATGESSSSVIGFPGKIDC